METLAEFIKRNDHQAIYIIKESALAMGYTQQQWAEACATYYTSSFNP